MSVRPVSASNSLKLRLLVFAGALLASAASFAAALPPSTYAYPKPGKSDEASILCTTCPGASLNLPTTPYGLPLKRFVGRMLDSTRAVDIQAPVRTLRARGGMISSRSGRLYMMFGGSKFAAWNLSTLFSSKLGQPLVQLSQSRQTMPELYLPWTADVDADNDGNWQTVWVDGQNRLGGFDLDDRGFIYLAYGPYGWGIVQDTGNNSGFSFVSQTVEWAGVAPNDIRVVRAGKSYYALILNPTGASVTAIYDVTRPGYPERPWQINRTPLNTDKIEAKEEDILAVTSASMQFEIYKASDFVTGAPPVLQIGEANSPYSSITNDGTSFYALRSKWPFMFVDVFTPSVPGDATTFKRVATYAAGKGNPGNLRWADGYLTLTSRDASNVFDLRLFKATNADISEIDLGHFFQKYYVAAPTGYAIPDAYTHNPTTAFVHVQDGHTYLIYLGFGMADVFELQVETPALTFDPATDPNGDLSLTVNDVFYLVNYIFANGPSPVGTGDLNGDRAVNGTDVFWAINYLFSQTGTP